MNRTTTLLRPPPASAFGRAHRLTVADYRRMGETGILGPDLRTELIDGEIIEMPPIGYPHAGTVKLLANRLKEVLGPTAIIGVQDPVWLNDDTEPLPDISVLRPRPDFYRGGHPGPADCLLLIEVADSSLAYDRDVKLPRYARARIPEVWLVDLGGRHLTIYRSPEDRGYRQAGRHQDLGAVPVPIGGPERPLIDLRDLF